VAETKVTYPVQLPLDGCTWWGVRGGDADERLVCAKQARSAIAALKREWIRGDRANGASLAWAVQTVASAKWSTVGPFTTPQAYHRARKQMLWEYGENHILGNLRFEDIDANNREAMIEPLGGERGLERLEARIVRQFTDPGKIVV
jgi:hypothetical protein